MDECQLRSMLREVSSEPPCYRAGSRTSFGLQSTILHTSRSMTCLDEGTRNNQVYNGDGYIGDIELNSERTTPDFKGVVSSLTLMQN